MKLSEIYKAIAAGATTLAGMEGLAAAIPGADSVPWIHAAAVGFSALVSGATWFVRNKATFDQIAKAIDGDAVLATQVADKVANDPIVIDKVIKKNPDLVGELIDQYRRKSQ